LAGTWAVGVAQPANPNAASAMTLKVTQLDFLNSVFMKDFL
jgi:hypothetical protein